MRPLTSPPTRGEYRASKAPVRAFADEQLFSPFCPFFSVRNLIEHLTIVVLVAASAATAEYCPPTNPTTRTRTIPPDETADQMPEGNADYSTDETNNAYSGSGGIVYGFDNTLDVDLAILVYSVGKAILLSLLALVAVIAGGTNNVASGLCALVDGGENNDASSDLTVVSGGTNNTESGLSSSVFGGFINEANNARAVVAGGRYNTVGGPQSSVFGGHRNDANNTGVVLSCGFINGASAEYTSCSAAC
jgi:hypothetical protein